MFRAVLSHLFKWPNVKLTLNISIWFVYTDDCGLSFSAEFFHLRLVRRMTATMLSWNFPCKNNILGSFRPTIKQWGDLLSSSLCTLLNLKVVFVFCAPPCLKFGQQMWRGKPSLICQFHKKTRWKAGIGIPPGCALSLLHLWILTANWIIWQQPNLRLDEKTSSLLFPCLLRKTSKCLLHFTPNGETDKVSCRHCREKNNTQKSRMSTHPLLASAELIFPTVDGHQSEQLISFWGSSY